jgi:predicted phosphohydrolase
MRAVWLTDIHLDFLSESACTAFFESIASERPDAVFLTGDISVAPSLLAHLRAMADAIQTPIYFVLGNHDCYHGSIATVRAAVSECGRSHSLLRYLPEVGVVPLTTSTALVGHDGWGDSRYGDYVRSSVRLNDHLLIKELTSLTHSKLRERLRQLGNEAAGYLRETLPKALDQFRRVIVLTHVPPFKESCWYQGRLSNDEWLPFFACQAVGDVLRNLMEKRPDQQLDVYCGHTHNPGTAQILPNLRVFTGEAEYGAPQVNKVIEIG